MALTTVKGSVVENRSPYGFYTTVNATDPDNDIDISAGACWDTSRTAWLEGSAMTKRADAAWAAGDGNGFIDTGSVASDEGYHFYVMLNDVDGSVDYIMSLSDTWTGVTKPTNYTKGQLIGYNYRSGTSWKDIYWAGNYCQYAGGSAVAFVDTAINQQELFSYECKPVPHNCEGNWFLYVSNDTSTSNTIRLFANYSDGTATFVTSSTSFMVGMVQATSATGDFTRFGTMFAFRVNESREIMFGATEYGTSTLYAYVRGFWLANRLEATS